MRILLVLSTLILLSEQNVISELYKVVLVLNALAVIKMSGNYLDIYLNFKSFLILKF